MGVHLPTARPLSVAALLPIAGAGFALLASVADASAQGSKPRAPKAEATMAQAQAPRAIPACEEAIGISVMPSPVTPWKGAPLRVIFSTEKPIDGELALIAPDGKVAATSSDRHGGPPYFWFA